jgi:DNA uptake protein ComE-like DNA-binding protein
MLLIGLVMLSLAGGLTAGQGNVEAVPPAQHKTAVRPALIDINSASRAQLETLPGIGDAEAERIVAGRPYLSKAGLVTNKIIPAGVYQAIRHRIIAIQHAPPASKRNGTG